MRAPRLRLCRILAGIGGILLILLPLFSILCHQDHTNQK
jgi:hypothetical protein